MAANYRKKKNNKKILWTLIAVGAVLLIAGLVTFLVKDAKQKKNTQAVTEAVESYLSKELGADMVSVDVARNPQYGFYTIAVSQKNVSALAKASSEGDEKAAADWNKIVEAYAGYAADLEKTVGEIEEGFSHMLYMGDADVENSMLLWYYGSQLMMNAGAQAENTVSE